ncbi:MAG: hypothetical protein R3Y04_03325 [Rikenellaceae bacterium]
MKNKIILTILMLCALSTSAQEKYLIAGSGSPIIAIYDKQSNAIEWSYELNSGDECNCVIYDNKKVAFSYSNGMKLINMNGETIFDYKVNDGEQAQSVSKIKKGYLVGICGSPARIVELNKKGEVINEIHYNTSIDDAHSQFRQIRKTSNNTYLVPLLAGSKIVELSKEGEFIREIKLSGGPFSVTETKSGDLLTACGHSGAIFKVESNSENVTTLISNTTLPSNAKIEFGAEVVELKNGNILLANWLGHNGDTSQPMLMEIDSNGNVVWQLNILDEISLVSTVYPLY